MSQENVEMVGQSYDALARGDLEAALADADPEIEVYDHDILDAHEYRGVEGVLRWQADWEGSWETWRWEPEDFIDAGDRVVAILRVRAKGRQSGVEVERVDGAVFTFEHGKVVRLDYYNDRRQALKSVGLEEENVEIVRRAFDGFYATGEPVWDLTDEHVVVADHDLMDAGEYRGHAGLTRWLEDWASAWSGFTSEPAEEILDAGDDVVIVYRLKATGRASGVTIERRDAMVCRVQNGKIVRIDYYNNREQAIKAAGLEE